MDSKNIFDGFADFHRLSYIREILVGELGFDEASTTLDKVEELSDSADVQGVKVSNLSKAFMKYFPDIFITRSFFKS